MKEELQKNKKWALKATAVFFVVLLLLTFFSNTIMNYSLPQVATQYVESGVIASKVRGSGVVAAAEPYNVTVSTERKIKLVLVKEGDVVEEGTLLAMFEDGEDSELSAAKKTLEQAKESYQQYIVTNEISDAQIAKAEDGTAVDYDSYRTQLTSATAVVESAQKSLDDHTAAVKEWQTKVEQLQKKLESITDEQEYETKNAELVKAQAQLDAENAAVETATEALSDAQEAHQDVLDAMNQELELTGMYEAVVEAQAAIDKINTDASGNKLTATTAGVVGSVNISKGQTAVPGETLMTIVSEENGYTATITVTTEQARRIKVGDTADISESWYYYDVAGEVSAIRNDTENPGRSKLVDIKITGSVDEGTTLNFAIGEKNNSYDMIVPNGAVREDKNGKFILIIRQKSSPLGNRYFAKRVDVEVIASDDVNSAITGDLEGYEYVITTSTKAIQPGDQVRLTEG